MLEKNASCGFLYRNIICDRKKIVLKKRAWPSRKNMTPHGQTLLQSSCRELDTTLPLPKGTGTCVFWTELYKKITQLVSVHPSGIEMKGRGKLTYLIVSLIHKAGDRVRRIPSVWPGINEKCCINLSSLRFCATLQQNFFIPCLSYSVVIRVCNRVMSICVTFPQSIEISRVLVPQVRFLSLSVSAFNLCQNTIFKTKLWPWDSSRRQICSIQAKRFIVFT